jgi:glycosyltransferase involved in cell wall biosynthesis
MPVVAMLVRNAMVRDSRVEKEARTLVAAGYEVVVVAHAGAGLPEREERDGYRIRRVARASAAIPGVRFFRHAARLRDALLAEHPDVLHAHDSDALRAVGQAAQRAGVPFVYDAHELWLHRPRRGRSRPYQAAARWWYGRVERNLLPQAAAVVTVSEPIARHLEREYALPRVDVVANYPTLDELADGGPSRSIRDLPGAGGIPEDAPIVLYLGGLMAERGLESLVAAMPAVDGNAHLVLLGEGELAPRLREQAEGLGIAGRVHVLAPVPVAQVVAYAASADLGISPTVDAGLNNRYSLPNKLFQYMAAGLPVVASDFPQIRAVVEDSGTGVTVDTADPGRLAAAITGVLARPDRGQGMGRAGREAVIDRFHWGVAEAALLAAYERVARRAGAAS